MIRSMTGYGRGNCTGGGFAVTAELRSVNHRYADFFLRIPRELYLFEERIRRLLKKEIGRGRIEVNITLSSSHAGAGELGLNEELATAYYRTLEGLADKLQIPLSLRVAELVQLPGVLQAPGAVVDDETLWPVLEKALKEALESLVEHRKEEGDNLVSDLRGMWEQLAAFVDDLASSAPAIMEEQKLQLENRLTGMLEAHFDQNRILAECAILGERMDVHEEMVRLGSHLKAFENALAGEGPAGRRLDFIAQEIFREINTVGSKSQDYRIAALVVEIKAVLEKMREQIQNIE